MITRLKRRFIALAMISLTFLLSGIVAGMNIINYSSVVREADSKLETLSENRGRLPVMLGEDEDGFDVWGYEDWDDDDWNFGLGGFNQRPHGMSRDEAEETRFFTVLMDKNSNIIIVNTERISAVDEQDAAQYAVDILHSGKEKGFVEDYRYVLTSEANYYRATFLDCGRTLGAFRRFMFASIAMSAAGLALVFVVIVYFAGRIVKPVAESYEKQKRFITDAGHEIKTPLTIIKANLDLMKMDIGDSFDEGPDALPELAESLNESLDDIGGQVDRLTNLTNDLVYLSRMEEGGASLTMTDVPLSDIVKETAESFTPVAEERNKKLKIETEPLLSVRGSTNELEKLVSILVENALKYSPEGDCIGVNLHKEGRNAVLEVRNKTTNPVSDEDLAHIFERFYRTDKSRNSAAGGHGIGLSMASAIVNAHGGKIRARSGDGTDFIVTATMPA